MRKRRRNVESSNHERYLITYSDLITLLLVFFIVLYAMSDVNQEKYTNLANTLHGVFQSQTQELGIQQEEFVRRNITPDELAMMKAIKEQQKLRELKETIDKEIEKEGLTEEIQTVLYDGGLRIVLTNRILFSSGEAMLTIDSKYILHYISTLIETVDNPIQVNGYTDNIPISTPRYPSNWELSAARSIAVLKHLLDSNPHLVRERFSATGYGEYHPIDSNLTNKGRERNRRVEIIVEREFGEGLLQY